MSEAQLVIKVRTSSLKGQVFSFDREELLRGVLIGRDDDCDISFDPEIDVKVSGQHIELKLEEGTLVVRDVGSSNGTFLGDERLEPEAPIEVRNGMTLTLGRAGAELTLTRRSQSVRSVPTLIEDDVEDAENPLTVDVIVDEIAADAGVQTRDMMKAVARQLDSRSKAKHRSLVRTVAVFAVLILGALGIFLWQRPGPTPPPVVVKQPPAKPAKKSAREELQKHYVRYKPSIVLIFATVNLTDATGSRSLTISAGVGTGWIVKIEPKAAYVVTNKHVAQGFKFQPTGPMLQMMQAQRMKPDPRTVRYTIWAGGTTFRSKPEGGFPTFDFTTCWTSIGPKRAASLGNVTFIGAAPDEWNPGKFPMPGGAIQTHKVQTRHDLALLRLERDKPDTLKLALPLARRGDGAGLAELTQVATLGYPLGMGWVGKTADPSPTIGEVRGHMPASGTLKVGAFTTGGNSGGPVIDRRGRVVGVHARGLANLTGFGGAIHVKFVHDLLEAQLGPNWKR